MRESEILGLPGQLKTSPLMTRVMTLVMAVVMALVVASPGMAQQASTSAAQPDRFGFGEPAPHTLIEDLDIDVRPDGKGLPEGQGTAQAGAALYRRLCASCHGPAGEGATANPLVGTDPPGIPPFGPEYEAWRGSSQDVPLTVGNYWPFATTLFDYIRRAMPTSAPGSLQTDEVFSLVAWVLAENEIIPSDAAMNAETLPQVRMPARGRFVPDDRRGGPDVR